METKKALVAIGFLSLALGASARADEARFCINFEAVKSATGQDVGSASCEVLQYLTWSDYRSQWKCWFSTVGAPQGLREGLPKMLVTEAQLLGYSYDLGVAYSDFQIGSGTSLGNFLLGNIALGGVKKSSRLRIYYTRKEPTTDDRTLILASTNEVFELRTTDLAYGPCRPDGRF